MTGQQGDGAMAQWGNSAMVQWHNRATVEAMGKGVPGQWYNWEGRGERVGMVFKRRASEEKGELT
jgi:hypothetical protein